MIKKRVHERWAHLRFSVIGQLLAAPPEKGALRAELAKLSAREWRHPTTGEPVHFGASTIERWYYRALKERQDPVGVLRRKVRHDAGQQAAIGAPLRRAVLSQYAGHKSWSVRLHHANLVALAEKNPELQPVPSYATLQRFFKAHGLEKRRRLTSRKTEGALLAEARLADREVRSYEAEYVNQLWHWDFHHGSRKVLTPQGEWETPLLFGIIDDRSRLACHLQWYLAETAENVAHGLSQAMQKRGMPRAATFAVLRSASPAGISHWSISPTTAPAKSSVGCFRRTRQKMRPACGGLWTRCRMPRLTFRRLAVSRHCWPS